MELEIFKRKVGKKSDVNQLRRQGKIPVVLYGPKCEAEAYAIEGAQWLACLRQIPKGGLSTVIFDLKGEGKPRRGLVKEIQYHPTTYEVLHLDFVEVRPEVHINVKVPLRFTGVEECVGIKQGGVLRPIIRATEVSCLPEAIPKELTLDVADLNLKQSRRLSAITMPTGVRPLAKLHEVAVVIAKR
jgi:large subunit ribosomal protein L25